MKRVYSVFGLTFLCLSLSAQNQYFNQQLLPLGDESALLANSGIAGQSPNSAVLFNPAALVLNEGNSFSFSGNAYYEFLYTAESIAQLGNQSVDLQASGLQVMPTSMIYHLDKWDWDFSFALSSPAYMSYSGFQSFEAPSNGGLERLNLSESFGESMYSGFLGAGKDIGSGWSLGLAIYGNYYSMSSHVSSNSSNTNNPSAFVSVESFQEATSISLGFMLGLLKQWPKLNWGLSFSSANTSIYAKGRSLQTSAFALTIPTFIDILEEDLNTHLSNAYRIGTGINYKVLPKLEYSFDFNYFGAQSQGLFPGDLSGPASYRFSTGLKLQSQAKWSNYLGFAYLPGSADKVQRETYVFTAGTRLQIKSTLNTIGLFFAESTEQFGNGTTSFEFFGILVGSSVNLDF